MAPSRLRPFHIRALGIVAVAGLVFTAGCSTVGYYVQSVTGHLGLMAEREPIERVLADPATPPRVRERLALARDIRDFASRELALPENGSYRSYVHTGRRFVVWNVVAAPELSLGPKTWCFPVVGCLSYRGYYDREDAAAFARRLAESGLDVYTAGVRAYSTLGWFDDPVLDTMLAERPFRLAALIFHELAHQVVYVRGDTAFNEAFAVAVEREGLRRWLAGDGMAEERRAHRQALARHGEFIALVLGARARLAAVYGSDAGADGKRRAKREILSRLEGDYRALRRSWDGARTYDGWFSRDLNNAKLASIATYFDLVPGFARLLADRGGDLPAFYRTVEGLAELTRGERRRALGAAAGPGSRSAARPRSPTG